MNIKASRRSFFGFVAAAPIASKAIAEDIVAKQASINISGIGNGNLTVGTDGSLSPSDYKIALSNPITRKAFESFLYEQERRIYSIDPDIAVHRSHSLAAKIVYQRERNVARGIAQVQSEYPWNRITRVIKETLGVWA